MEGLGLSWCRQKIFLRVRIVVIKGNTSTGRAIDITHPIVLGFFRGLSLLLCGLIGDL
jgi:hypothetical protein